MGTRIHKILGYGSVTLPKNSVNKVNLYGSLKDFWEWLEQESPEDYKDLWFLDEKSFKEPVHHLIQTVFSDEDDDFSLWNGKEGVVIVPPVLTDEAHAGDTAFTFAELEKLNKQSLTDITCYGYSFSVPPFPTEYQVFNKTTGELADHSWETYRYLRRLQEGDVAGAQRESVIAHYKTGFKTAGEVEENLELVPPQIIKHICDFFHVFDDPNMWKKLTPTVLYYWT